jgi:regulator of replication initiation timing
MVAVLLNYEKLRNEITDRIEELKNRITSEYMTVGELRDILMSLLTERELILEEINELREARYGWMIDDVRCRDSMKLMLSELNEETYNDLSSLASKLNISVGSLLNEMMNRVNQQKSLIQGEFPTISSKDLSHLWKKKERVLNVSRHNNFVVTKTDMEKVDTRVKFSHINTLIFDSSIQENLFHEKIKSINHCEIVKFPRGFSKLLAYAKSSHCSFFEFTTRAR